MDAKSSPTTTKPETPLATTKTSSFVKQYLLSWALFISFFFLFINSINAVIVLLFLCIDGHKKAPEGSKQQMRNRIAIWLLGASLNAGIAYKASTVMPLALGAILWSLAGTSTLGSFYLFFVLSSQGRDSDAGPKEPLLVCNALTADL